MNTLFIFIFFNFFFSFTRWQISASENEEDLKLICERNFYDQEGQLFQKEIYSDIEELTEKIENDVLPANGAFEYLNVILKGENMPSIQQLVESYLGPMYLVMAGYYN